MKAIVNNPNNYVMFLYEFNCEKSDMKEKPQDISYFV